MDQINQWVFHSHAAIAAIAGFWLFSALVSGMPAPKESSGIGYVWLYNSLHMLASNLNNLFQKKNLAPELMPQVTPPVTQPEVKQ
jgi:hypothetical protein